MPLPKPNKNEKESAFISRCMRFLDDEDSSLEGDQRVAACYSQWRRKGKGEDIIESNSWFDAEEEADEGLEDLQEGVVVDDPIRAQTGSMELGSDTVLSGSYPSLDDFELPDYLKPGKRLYPGEDEELLKLP